MPAGSAPGERRGGRKKGTPNKRPGSHFKKSKQEIQEVFLPSMPGSRPNPGSAGDPYYGRVDTPLEFLLLMMNDTMLDVSARFAAVREALPYVHSKMATQPYRPPDHDGRIFIEVVEFSEADFEE